MLHLEHRIGNRRSTSKAMHQVICWATGLRAAELEDIEKYLMQRLATIFRGGVLDQALRLGLPGKPPMYSLIFACGNPANAASRLAFRLARAALKKGAPHGRR